MVQQPDFERQPERASRDVLNRFGRLAKSAAALHEARNIESCVDGIRDLLEMMVPDVHGIIHLSGTVTPLTVRWGGGAGDGEENVIGTAMEVASTGVSLRSRDDVFMPLKTSQTTLGTIHARIDGERFPIEEYGSWLELVAVLAAPALSTVMSRDIRLEGDLAMLFSGAELPFADARRAFERWLVESYLERYRSNIAAAARALQMDRAQLSRLVKRHGIDKVQFKRT